MEVVSPLSYSTKRLRSPLPPNEEDVAMDDTSCGYQAKRRKHAHSSNVNVTAGEAGGWMSPFVAGGSFVKRSRSRSPPHSPKLQSELLTLKSQNTALLSQNTELSSQNSSLSNENKLLKRAVSIQQERQSVLTSELQTAKSTIEEAMERMRRLEQMNLTLRYQLEAMGQGVQSREFMGFGGGNPRPPDVY